MAKSSSMFVCQQCGNESAKWLGRCPNCGEWNSFVETTRITGRLGHAKHKSQHGSLKPQRLSGVETKKLQRISTHIAELDRVFGGGIVPGQVTLLAGEPGIGKSTILLQVAEKLGNTLYVSGEESPSQIKLRASRLGLKDTNILLLDATDIDAIAATVENLNESGRAPSLLIIDSIQTMYTTDLSGMAGSVGQVRESAARLVKLAKRYHIPIIIVGQVTKEGSVAGPAALMHIVDTVLWFEGEKTTFLRLIRTVKNRFGPTDEIGIFQMEEKGLVSVDNSAEMFVTKQEKPVSGSAIACILEGTRPLLVEVQSLVVPTRLAIPRRVAQGIDSRRLELIQAVLTRRAGLNVSESDIFVKVVGGIQIREPGADLAIALSIASAFTDKPIPRNIASIGEVGLLGEIRSVVGEEERKKYSKRQGFVHVLSSKTNSRLPEIVRKFIK